MTHPLPSGDISAPPAISIRRLRKIYKSRDGKSDKEALKGIDLDIPRGSMFALLGPNGAGKSTCINILAGLVNKTAGTASVWGFDIDKNPRNAKASIGVVPQELIFDAFFTPREVLEIQAGMFGIPKSARMTDEILERVALADKADAYARTLSGGMKRRLLIGKAMVHNPPVLILDEPTAGVDIELRRQLWANVRDLHTRGTTIVLTTHYLEEAQELCDHIAIINHGEVVAYDRKDRLMSAVAEKEVTVTVDKPMEMLLPSLSGMGAEQLNPQQIKLRYDKNALPMSAILAALSDAGFGISDISTDEADLEDIFLEITQKSA
ncbi:MAG: ABC transporter ATP-binding protein [Pseudomonadota bacterium]